MFCYLGAGLLSILTKIDNFHDATMEVAITEYLIPYSILPNGNEYIIQQNYAQDSYPKYYKLYNSNWKIEFYIKALSENKYIVNDRDVYSSLAEFMVHEKILPCPVYTVPGKLEFIIIPEYYGKFNINVYFNSDAGYSLKDSSRYGQAKINPDPMFVRPYDEDIILHKCGNSSWVDYSGHICIPDRESLNRWINIFEKLYSIKIVSCEELMETYYDPEQFYRVPNDLPEQKIPEIGYDTVPIRMIFTANTRFNIVIYEVLNNDELIGYTMYSFNRDVVGYEIKWNESMPFFSDKENLNWWLDIFGSLHDLTMVRMENLHRYPKNKGWYYRTFVVREREYDRI